MRPDLALAGSGGDETLLYRRVDGQVTAFREDCGPGNALIRVAGDHQGWAALTRQWLLLGGFSPASPEAQEGQKTPGSD